MEQSQQTPRRHYSAQLESQVLAQCAHPGTSMAQVARELGLNASLIRSIGRGRRCGLIRQHLERYASAFKTMQLATDCFWASIGE